MDLMQSLSCVACSASLHAAGVRIGRRRPNSIKIVNKVRLMIVLPDSVNIVFSMRIQHIYTCVYDDKWESHSLASQNNLYLESFKIDLRRKRDILLSPSWSLSNDNNPGNGRLLRVMCHVLFSDILLSIISIWVIGSFLLFLQINRQIGSCRRCKRTETIGILVTIICTSALLLQHLYYLLGVCVVTVACQ